MTFEDAKAAAREEWGRATAWRVGVAVGKAASPMRDPYPPRSRSSRQFAKGVRYGREWREKREEQS